MDEDNLYQNDGEWFAASSHQVSEAEEEQFKLSKARPLVRDVIKRLNERISFYGTIDSITVSLADEPAKYQQVLEANRLVRQILTEERDYIMSLLEKKR